MRLPPQHSRSPLEPSLALINVVFLLLLFFVVTGTIVYQYDRSIVPPTSFLLAPGRAPADAIYISAEGTLSFRGEVASPAEIAQALQAGGNGDGQGDAVTRTVQVVADHRLQAQMALRIIDALREQGLQGLSIVTVRDIAQ